MPFLEKCLFCCCPVGTSAIVVAAVNLLSSIPAFIWLCVFISQEKTDYERDLVRRLDTNRVFDVSNMFDTIQKMFYELLTHENAQIFVGIFLVYFFLQILANLLVCFAVYKKNTQCFRPYIYIEAIGALLYTAFTSTMIGLILKDQATILVIALACFVLVPMAIYVYMWLVVYSHYAILQQENNRGRYDKQPYRR